MRRLAKCRRSRSVSGIVWAGCDVTLVADSVVRPPLSRQEEAFETEPRYHQVGPWLRRLQVGTIIDISYSTTFVRSNAERALRIRSLEDENTFLQMEILNVRHEKSIVAEELKREKQRSGKIRDNVSRKSRSLLVQKNWLADRSWKRLSERI